MHLWLIANRLVSVLLESKTDESDYQHDDPKEFLDKAFRQISPEGFPTKNWRAYNEYTHRHRAPRRNSYFYKYKAPHHRRYAVRFHSTDVLSWDERGNCYTTTGGYYSKTTFERINLYLPHGWRIFRYQHEHYWWNNGWPSAMRAEIHITTSRRRPADRCPHMFIYRDGDWISNTGDLHSISEQKVITKNGEMVPDRPIVEGKYQNHLAWIRHIRRKHEKIKDFEKAKRDLDKVDDPDKKKRKLNLH